MSGNSIVLLVTILASLFLAVRSDQLNFRKTATMAGIWVLIIAALAFIIQRFAS